MVERPIKLKASAEFILGEYSETVDGDKYKGSFKGRGFIDQNQDNGSFLSLDSQAVHEGRAPYKILEMGDLFPDEWQGERVEYEITVWAKKIENPTQP